MEEKKDEQTQVENASSQEVDLAYKNGRERVKSGVLGFFIGLAVIVPGVSGSAVVTDTRRRYFRFRRRIFRGKKTYRHSAFCNSRAFRRTYARRVSGGCRPD